MEQCIAEDVPSGLEELDTATVSRLLTGSRAIPFAILRHETITFANPAFMSMFRSSDSGISGMPLAELIASPSQARTSLSKLLADPTETPVTLHARATRLDGSPFDAELLLAREMVNGLPMICVFAADVTARRFAENHLSALAYTDMLTGLPNRALVMDRLRDAIVEARGGDTRLAVLMADLDGLKRANDTFGHQAGDVVLQVTARRFTECIRDRDTLARLGGDEFCIVLPRVRDSQAAEMIANRLVEAARHPIPINGQDVYVGVSVGIALFPDHGSTGDTLVAAADAALYEAKRGGRNCYAAASVPSCAVVASVPLITWTAAHDVGIAMMDRQHRELADRINELAVSLKDGDGPAAIAEKLAQTLSYTRHHFASEERLMDERGFADAAAHRAIHAALLDDLQNFATGCDTRSLSLTTRFLQEWLLRHVDSADRDLAKVLIVKGGR